MKLSPLGWSHSRSLNRSRSPSRSSRLRLSPLGWSRSRSLNRSRSPSSRLQRRLPGKRPVLKPLVLEHLLPRLREEGFLNFSICLEPYRLRLYKEIRIEVVFEGLLLHAIQPPLSFQPRFLSSYAWTLVERNVLAQALRGFASGQTDIDDLANIDKNFQNVRPYVDTFAVPPALNDFSNTSAVDWISYGHLRVEIADQEVKTSHGGDINMLYADKINLVIDKDTGLPHIFSFPSEKFVAPPPEFEFRPPKVQDYNMVAQSYKRNPSLSAENFSVSFPVYGVSSGEYEPLALTMANFKELVAAFEGGEDPRLADSSSYKPEIDVNIKFLGSHGALQANIDGSHRREAKRMVKENYPEIYKANKGIRFTSDKMYIGLSPEVCRYMSMKLN
eukprot:jgi/Tetstr1/445413/TSEL_033196.t1